MLHQSGYPPVDLLRPNGFGKPFASGKFEYVNITMSIRMIVTIRMLNCFTDTAPVGSAIFYIFFIRSNSRLHSRFTAKYMVSYLMYIRAFSSHR